MSLGRLDARRRRVAALAALVSCLLAAPSQVRADASCPGDLVLECGDPNVDAARQAWLDSFSGTPGPGCANEALSFQISPGILIGQVAYPDFADVSMLTLNGATGLVGNPVLSNGRSVLRLTNDLRQSGSAFVTNPLSLELDASFSAFFSFQISNPIGSGDADGLGADGIVFVVQTVANTAGGTGGGIGYQGIPRSFGIEMDTYNNGAWDDQDGNHVGIDLEGNTDAVVQAAVTPRLNDGAIWHAWVEYDGLIDRLEVRVSTERQRPVDPLLILDVDLAAILASPDAYVGFTSGTGSAGGFHDILAFYFENTRSPLGCGSVGAQSVALTVIDDCENAFSCTSVLSFHDVAPPVLTAAPLPACVATAGEAEALALAATTAVESCSPPLEITASASGACDGVVRVTASDSCGNTSFIDQPIHILNAPPSLAPTAAGVACGGVVQATLGAGNGATVDVGVGVLDGCPPLLVTNDRTAGGADATDFYPCGFTLVTFQAEDACGRTASCLMGVRVNPPRAGEVGPALRVRKDALGVPTLDWSLAASSAGPQFAVLRGDGRPVDLSRAASPLSGTTWVEVDPAPRLLFYDVRGVDCAAELSDD